MKLETTAQILADVNRAAKVYEAASAAGDNTRAADAAGVCIAGYRRLSEKVPLRGLFYIGKAKEWEKKLAGVKIPGAPPEMEGPAAGKRMAGGVSTADKSAHEIFISYSNPDKTVAFALCAYLEKNGLSCWIAPRDVLPGTNFPASIIDAIDQSRAVVLLFSKASNNSPHVIRELTRAVTKNVLILPFRIEDVPLSKNMQYLINLPHWFEATSPPPEQHFDLLAKTLRAHLEQAEKETAETGDAGA